MTKTLLPELTAVPGLRFRAYAGEGDIPAIAALCNLVAASQGVTVTSTVEQTAVELRNTPNVDPGKDFILAFAGSELVAYSSMNWADTSDGRRLYRSLGWVHPGWRRRGIGAAMLRRNEERLTRMASSHQHTLEPRLMTWLEDGDLGGHALFAARGYDKVRVYHHMTRPDMESIELPSLPAGLEERVTGREHLPRLWDAMHEAFRDHFGGHDQSPEAYRAWEQDPNLDTRLFAVAWDGDEIAGGVLGYVVEAENQEQGYLRGWADPVFTRQPWRRRGLARAMMGRCLALLRDAGMTSAQLDVDIENANNASTLYRSHRFETDRASTEWHKPLPLSSVGPAHD